MKKCRPRHLISVSLAFWVLENSAFAEQHIQEILKDTNEAVESEGDSESIGRHAADALEHIDAAKQALAARPDVLEYIKYGEDQLNSAVMNASRFNSPSAWEDAVAAKRYFEAADLAASGEPPR